MKPKYKFLSLLSLLAIFFICSINSAKAVPNGPIRVTIGIGVPCHAGLGVCIIIPLVIVADDYALTASDSANGLILATIQVVGSQVDMIFSQPTAMTDGTIPISSNWDLGSAVATALGYSDVTVLSGTYTVGFATYPLYGDVYMNSTLTP